MYLFTKSKSFFYSTSHFISILRFALNELKFLLFAGDEIPKEDTVKLLDELAGVEDEDGFIPYKPFVDKLCGKA